MRKPPSSTAYLSDVDEDTYVRAMRSPATNVAREKLRARRRVYGLGTSAARYRTVLGTTVAKTLACLLLGTALGTGSAAEDDQASGAKPSADEALIWRVLRHRWWRDPPEAPDIPTVEPAGHTSVTVTWMVPDSTTDIADYDVEYRDDGESAFTSWEHTGAATGTVIEGLAPAAAYHVRVRATNDAGPGDWSASARGITHANEAPVFDEGERADRSLAEDVAAGHRIGRPVAATDPNGDDLTYGHTGRDAEMFSIHASSGQLVTSIDASFDHEETTSHEVVVTVDDVHGGQSRITVDIAVADVDEPPGLVPTPTVSGASATAVTVNWTDPANDGPPITDYDLRYRTQSGDAYFDAGHDGTSTTATITALAPSTTYEVQIRATNDEGTSGWSTAGTGSTLANRAPVFDEGSSASRTLAENSSGNLDIGAPIAATDPDDDAITYSLDGADAGAFTVVDSTGQLRSRSDQVYDHEADDSLEIVVVASDDRGNEAEIGVTVHVTDVSEPPLPPDAPSVQGELETLIVTWEAPENTGRPGITGYNLRYRGSRGSFILWRETPTNTQTEMQGLKPDTYEIQVRAHNDEGKGAWSESGQGTVRNNRAPTVDHDLLNDVVIGVDQDGELVQVGAAFSDPDGDLLTLGASSSDDDIVTATLSGDFVSLHPVAVGSADINVTATDTYGATATGSFKVTVGDTPPPPVQPPAPAVELNGSQTELTVEFGVTLGALETKAFRIRIRQANTQAGRTYCFRLRNNGDEAIRGTITADIPVGSFVLPDTTYLVDYRHMGDSCSDTATGLWSQTAQFTVTALPSGGNFDIDIAFVGQVSAAVRSAVNSAASVWEQAITNDLTDIDYSGRPTSNACTDAEFDGVVDDLRLYVREQSIDGDSGTLATAGVCSIRASSGLPIMSRITLDAADVNRLGSATLYNVALHEIAHTLGFGVLWENLLVDPSLNGGQPISPPPDTHFAGPSAIAAFDDAGGTNYQGKKVPVENERGGQGAQDAHWRKSVMGSELMTYTLGSSGTFSAITIQSMADIGYHVDTGVADSYTLANVARVPSLAAGDDARAVRQCIVHPLTGIDVVPDPKSIALPDSAIRLRVNDPRMERVEPKR